jgi:hypothetical protein
MSKDMDNYDRNVVLCAYRAAHPDNLEVSDDTLKKFDENLARTFDSEILAQADANGISTTKFNRSMLVLFAQCSTAKAVRTRVRHACRYFLAVAPTA